MDMLEGGFRSGTWNNSANNLHDNLGANIRRLCRLRGNVGLMWDYSDFNINHTHKAMLSLYDAGLSAIQSRGRSRHGESYRHECIRDAQACYRWLAESRVRTVLEDTESGLIALAMRSMQSGERMTSFQNTTLNRAYTIVHGWWTRAHLGRVLILGESYHQGDDIYALAKNVCDGVLACIVYNLLGYAGAAHKVLCDYRGRAEFLRLHYDLQEVRIAGYPIRGGMGLVNGEFFRDSASDPVARAGSFIDQFNKVQRRGGRVSPRVLDLLLDKKASLAYRDTDGQTRHVRAKVELLMAPRQFGGYGLSTSQPTGGAVTGLSEVILTLPEGGEAAGHLSIPLASRSVHAVIPSGEGKTTLARRYPGLFLDHDDLVVGRVHDTLVATAQRSGKWDLVTAYHRRIAEEARAKGDYRTLLTWGPEQADAASTFIGVYMLTEGTHMRANDQNRADLREAGFPASYQTFAARDRAIHLNSLRAHAQAEGYARQEVLFTAFTHSGEAQPPLYQPPKVPLAPFFGKEVRARTDAACALPDFRVAHELGTTRVIPRMQRIILESALPGSYPSQAVSDALARFGSRLDAWLQGTRRAVTPVGVIQTPIGLTRAYQAWATGAIKHFLADLVATAPPERSRPGTTPADAAPTVPESRIHLDLNNNYGAASALVRPAGFSSEGAFIACLGELQPLTLPGDAGRYCRLLASKPEIALTRPGLYLRRLLYSGYSRAVLDNHLRYFRGELDLLPPAPSGSGSLLYSVARAATLSFLEKRLSGQLLGNTDAFVGAVYRLEALFTTTFLAETTELFGRPLEFYD